jgi:hypothetical protein
MGQFESKVRTDCTLHVSRGEGVNVLFSYGIAAKKHLLVAFLLCTPCPCGVLLEVRPTHCGTHPLWTLLAGCYLHASGIERASYRLMCHDRRPTRFKGQSSTSAILQFAPQHMPA